jgi:ferredoxin
MKVLVDTARCKVYAVCMFESPKVFDGGGDNIAVVLEESPPDELRTSVEAAVRQCPAQAITLIDDGAA